MAHPDRKAWGVVLATLGLAASSCTAFNGKTIYGDAGAAGEAGAGCGCASVTGAVVCEDFEASPSAIWSALGDGPTPDPTRAHCGAASIHLHAPALKVGDAFVSALTQSATFADPRLTGGFFARAWVYLPTASKIADNNYVSLIEARQAADPYLGVGAQVGPNGAALSDWTTAPAGYASTAGAVPRDQWTCIEWQVAYSAAAGATKLWLGGASDPAASLEATNTQPSPPYAAMLVGLYYGPIATPQPAFDLWLDDLVISGERVGCGK
jgi:hypothetical protein